ncbi:T9SS type A sorting domain-containing protein [Flavobacterium sp.]|uniref:T9SS type A sorting domain-containing protein n=1 Tax=Flavobacterium sp. TaxID=239 RepID=UPI003C58218A
MKTKLFLAIFLITIYSNGQSYPGPVGQSGSTAIAGTSTVFKSWATGAVITRGPQDIKNPTGPFATVGTADSAIGTPNGSGVVSLGDGGNAIVTFDKPIMNGTGYDFAVFENSFSDTFLELAFVEVSSDGINFFRFPSHSQTQTTTQVGGFGSVDATYIHNLAGKYKANYGTPFDLSDLDDNALLDKNKITHVKIIDVIGTIDPLYATYDSKGNIINELYSTSFPSGGFDLDAVGVINQIESLAIDDFKEIATLSIYPNPVSDVLFIMTDKEYAVAIYDFTGRVVKKSNSTNGKQLFVSDLVSGNYFAEFIVDDQKIIKKIIVK